MYTIVAMRAFIASTVGAAFTAALVVPLAMPPAAALAQPGQASAAVQFSASPPALPAGSSPSSPSSPFSASSSPTAPGSSAPANAGDTQSLALGPLGSGSRAAGADAPTPGEVGLEETDVEPFSLLGVVWTDASAELAGEAEVRTRAAGSGEWSDWHHLHASLDHGPDPETTEERTGTLRGGTDPLWVGAADGVQVRVAPDGSADAAAELPEGLRLELIDPGDDPVDSAAVGEEHDATTGTTGTGAEAEADGETDAAPEAEEPRTEEPAASEPTVQESPVETEEAPAGETPADQPPAEAAPSDGEAAAPGEQLLAAPRPGVVTRSGWGANESWRESGFSYTDVVKTVFVHHTAGGNGYTCAEAPSVIRGIYQYHTRSQGWRDIGYNFLVDKCGTIYEGRAGGVDRAVMGAHTYGFNHNSMGVAVLGTHSSTAAPKKVTDALAQLSGWKLGLDGRKANGTWKRVSAGGKYAKGTVVTMHNISGHRDGFATDCPGNQLYNQLPAIRTAAARM